MSKKSTGEFWLYRVSTPDEYSISATGKIGSWARLCKRRTEAVTGISLQPKQCVKIRATFEIIESKMEE